MKPAEQESLLLRQLAALRRGGLPHDEALDLVRDGLPAGPLADRVDAARRALAAGGDAARIPRDRILGAGTAPVEALERAAAALDARMSADAALAVVRLYGSVAFAGPLVVGCLLGWTLPGLVSADGPGLFHWPVAEYLLGSLRVVGIPLAIGVVLVLRLGTRFVAPGVGPMRRGAALLEAAAVGSDPSGLLRHPAERMYLDVRTKATDLPQASAELAAELVRDGERTLVLFRHLAPVGGALIAVLITWPILGLVSHAIFRTMNL